MKIIELKPGMKRVDVTAKILEIGPPRDVTTRFGETSRVADATVQDESGSIKLSLWNDDIDRVHVNDNIHVENGYVTSFRGETQLNVGRYGKVSIAT